MYIRIQQRRVWKTKIRASVSSNASATDSSQPNGTTLNHQPSSATNNNSQSNLSVAQRPAAKSITDDVLDLDKILKEYEATIDRQREQIKYKNEQLEQQKSVFQYEKQQQYAELTKEINHLKNQRQVQYFRFFCIP